MHILHLDSFRVNENFSGCFTECFISLSKVLLEKIRNMWIFIKENKFLHTGKLTIFAVHGYNVITRRIRMKIGTRVTYHFVELSTEIKFA